MTERFVVSHGWQYAWSDPRHVGNYSIRECIKGPFAKPKLACPVPTVTYCQTDSYGNLQIPPNCWVEHLNNDIGSDYSAIENRDSMYRRYADVISPTRKNCVIAGQDLGQGIPDPWKASPYVGNLKTQRHFPLTDLLDLKKTLSLLLRSKSHQSTYKESPCFCCQKKYLFECPDKSNGGILRDAKYLNCSCLDCHKKTTKPRNDSDKRCLCLYRNRLLENEDSYEEKNSGEVSRKNQESDSLPSDSKSFSVEITENLVCTCGQNQNPSTNVTFMSTNEEQQKPKKDNINQGEFPKPTMVNVWCTQTRNTSDDAYEKKISFYPYVRNYESRKNQINHNDYVKNIDEETDKPKVGNIVSREVQTEISKAYISKNKKESSGQVESVKLQQRCSSCSDHKRKEKSKTKIMPPKSCFAYYMTQNLGSVCPYSCSNHFATHKPRCSRANGQTKKKTKRAKEGEKESEDGSSSNFSPTKEKNGKNECMKSKYRNWMYKYEPARNDNKGRDSSENCFGFQPSVPPFDQLKLIAKNKLRNYVNRKKLPTDTVNSNFFTHSNSSHMPSRYRDIFEGRAGWGDADMERYSQSFSRKRITRDRFLESSRDEKKFLSSKINNRRTFSDSGVRITTATARNKFSRKEPTKYLKEIVESDEAIAFGMDKNLDSSTKGGRRRKRLTRGRKKRRKIVGRKSLVFGKPSSNLKTGSKNTPADDTEVSEMDQNKLSPPSKKVNGSVDHTRKISEMLNHCHNLKYSNSFGNYFIKPYSNTPIGALTRIREEVFQNRVVPFDGRERQSEVDEVLERISYNKRNAWPSCSVGTTVGDLQFMKRPGRVYRSKPF